MATSLIPRIVSLVAVAALAVGTGAPPALASTLETGEKAPASASEPAARVDARAALAEARALTEVGGGVDRDASMILLELWRQRGALEGAERAAADELLARPSYPSSTCTPAICFHWTTSGKDAVSPADGDTDGIPDYVESVIETVGDVSSTYLAAGYRAPRSDGTAGGGPQIDIYLEDTGTEGTYGYCTTDMPMPANPTTFDAWAYCVLDNDFAKSQFPTNTPLKNLQVTAAHEFFHAVQYAYDVLEDRWFMESTAAWVEDELYDDVNDNLQYLSNSPMSRPGRPLDTYGSNGAHYGEWIFFRYLTESMPQSQGGVPTLVRDIWERADGAAGGPDAYSMQAVKRELKARGTTLADAFASFHAANRAPRRFYEEGAANRYPTAKPDGTFRLTKTKPSTGWKVTRLDHLSNATARFKPRSGLQGSRWKLKVSLDLPKSTTGSTAVIVLVPKSGTPTRVKTRLDADGDGTRRVPFGSSKVKYVEVTLTNGGARYNCWKGGPWSCQGNSRDDGRKLRFKARAVS